MGPELARLVRAIRSASGAVIAGGVAGGPLATLPRGDSGEVYPTYAAAFASSTEVDGETVSGELRVSRYVLGALGAGDVQAFRGVSASTPRGFAAVAEESGIDIDATLSVDAAGGSFPFWQAQADGLERRLLRFPVAVDDVPGEGPAAALAAAYVALRRNRGERRAHARRADARPPRLRGGRRAGAARRHAGRCLARHARPARDASGSPRGARPGRAAARSGRGWLVRLQSERAGGRAVAGRAVPRGPRHGA